MNVNTSTNYASTSLLQTYADSRKNVSASAHQTLQKNKVVHFSNVISVVKIRNGGREIATLSQFEELYRRHVDVQAKMSGMRCAYGHDNPRTDPQNFNLEFALKMLEGCPKNK